VALLQELRDEGEGGGEAEGIGRGGRDEGGEAARIGAHQRHDGLEMGADALRGLPRRPMVEEALRLPEAATGQHDDDETGGADEIEVAPAMRKLADLSVEERGEPVAERAEGGEPAERPAALLGLDLLRDDDVAEHLLGIGEAAGEGLEDQVLERRLREGGQHGRERHADDGEDQQPFPADHVGHEGEREGEEHAEADDARVEADILLRNMERRLYLRQGEGEDAEIVIVDEERGADEQEKAALVARQAMCRQGQDWCSPDCPSGRPRKIRSRSKAHPAGCKPPAALPTSPIPARGPFSRFLPAGCRSASGGASF